MTAPEEVYQLEEFESGFWKLIQILNKIKAKLKIESFLELADYFEYRYAKLLRSKTLTFMRGLCEFSPQVRKFNWLTKFS